MDESTLKLKGTTTVGIVCKDGVILASEGRGTLGSYVATQESQKIYKINDRMGMTTAGAAAFGEALVRLLKVETKLFEKRNDRPMGLGSAVTLLSNILLSGPVPAMLLFGGVEVDGTAKLFSLDAYGSAQNEKRYTCTGSGTPMASSVLDDSFVEGKDVKGNIPLAVRAINSARKRDIYSGGDIQLATITKDGYKQYTKEEIEKLTEKVEVKKK